MSNTVSIVRDGIGDLNATWGLCGFTSTFYVAWKLRPGLHPYLINASQPYSVLFEIVEYLEYLKTTGNVKFITEIEKYTQSFSGYSSFSCKKFRKNVYDKLQTGVTVDDLLKNSDFSIAMPPECVVHYCKTMWQFDSEIKEASAAGNAIIGVSTNLMNGLPYGNIAHYVYRHDNKIYSWGQCFNSIEEAGNSMKHKFTAVCAIVIK